MGRMKDLLLDRIYDLSDETGYDIEILLDLYAETGDFNQVVARAKKYD